ncbi:MAG: protein kinase [Planctomycetota bacterium]
MRAAVGPYTLDAELGRGGMGVVYAATAPDGTPVALKLLLPGAWGADTAARFQREAQALASLDHTHLVRCLDVGEHHGAPYFVMERVEGESLEARLRRDGPLSPADAVRTLAQVARALAALHAAGLVHRDVKPANVLLTSSGAAKLADLGLVTGVGLSRLTATAEAVGTPAYMAPEVVDGARAEAAADVYALGALGYEALSGAPPFVGPSLGVLATKLRRPAPPLPAGLAVSPSLRALIAACLERAPEARPSSAEAFLARLESLAPASPRASRAPLVAALAAALLIVGGAGSWAATRDTRPALPAPDAPAIPGALEEERALGLEAWGLALAVDLQGAEALARAELAAHPESPAPIVQLARILSMRQAVEQAMLLIDAGLERFPQHEELLASRQGLLARLESPLYMEASQALQRAHPAAPASAHCQAQLGVYPGERISALRQLSARFPDDLRVRLGLVSLEALHGLGDEAFRRTVERFPLARPLLSYARAHTRLYAGDPQEARALLAGLPSSAENPDVACLEAEVLRAEGDLSAGGSLLDRALELDPTLFRVWQLRLDSALRRKDLVAARAELAAAREAVPACYAWHLELAEAQVLALAGEVPAARDALARLRQEATRPWEAVKVWSYTCRLEGRILRGQGDAQGARELVARWTAAHPEDPRAWLELARHDSALGDHALAERHALHALELDPRVPECWPLIAGSRFSLGRGDVEQAVREARLHLVESALLRKLLAVALLDQGRLGEAAAEVEAGLATPDLSRELRADLLELRRVLGSLGK